MRRSAMPWCGSKGTVLPDERRYSRKTFTFIGFGGVGKDPVLNSPVLVYNAAGTRQGTAHAIADDVKMRVSVVAKTVLIICPLATGVGSRRKRQGQCG